MSFRDKDHPFWEWLRMVTLLSALLLFLYMNATDFDSSELKTFAEFALVAGGFQGMKSLLGKKSPEREQ